MKKVLIFALVAIMLIGMLPAFAQEAEGYTAPVGENVTYNLNVDWKYKRPPVAVPLKDARESVVKDGLQFYEVGYDDSDWENVSVPHAINSVDSFDNLGVDAGESGLYRGFSFYRKNITIAPEHVGKKFILEFEAVRQTVYLYVNGKEAGYYEAGVTAMGFDITPYIVEGENLIAVATDNTAARGTSFVVSETKPGDEMGTNTGWGYQWNTKDFNEVQGGITGNVNLYVKPMLYQTLPLYSNMKTTGNYVYATDFDILGHKAVVNVKAEIRNESGVDRQITVKTDVVDSQGKLIGSFETAAGVKAATDSGVTFKTVVPIDAYEENPAPTPTDTVEVTYVTNSALVQNLNFWSPDSPHLYDVYTSIIENGKVIDVNKITTGFRKVEYDLNDGGLKINERSVWLTGYAQRSTNEWAVIGVANDWLTDIDMQLVKESNANFIRWMHVAPKPNAIRSGDKYGVVSVCPAGDKEGDVGGRTWDMRVEAMRDAMIYFRNSPSVLFWESGNNQISPEHLHEMGELEAKLDPYTDRFSGCRTLNSPEQITETEFVGTMLNRHAAWSKSSMATVNKFVPIIETEYAREEAPRRVWDDFSPPDYDYRNKWLGAGAKKKDGFDVHDLTSEDFAISNVYGYNEFYSDRVGGVSGNDFYSAAAALVWSDSNQHVRNSGSENCRTSGKVDAVRIKKQAFYAYQAMQATEPVINIIGHWSYPQLTDDTYWYEVKEKVGGSFAPTGEKAQRDPKHKTVYVIGSEAVSSVELFVNGVSRGVCTEPRVNFIYFFDNIDVTESGTVSAKAYNAKGEVLCEDSIVTAGEKETVRLTPVTGPDGLLADGSDVMYFDVEIVDKDGNVCPLAYDKINLSVAGEGVLLGGYNSGEGDAVENYGWKGVNEIGADFVYAECGVNRVFVRSTREAGNITLTASIEGMMPVSRTVKSNPVTVTGGMMTTPQRSYKQGEVKVIEPETVTPLKPLAGKFTPDTNTIYIAEAEVAEIDTYTVTVNGKAVQFSESPYRPDSTTGVVCAIVPVLDELFYAGACTPYEWTTEIPSYCDGHSLRVNIIGGLIDGCSNVEAVNGSTTLFINQGSEKNLLNAETFINSHGDISCEIAPLLGYLKGVECNLNTETKTLEITYKEAE
ncbi:MAG: glycoside hydrolase family 2 protein [Clostridia bacterium]|nr:glycoside hydrolase family 2 protein [Clostridia bacterium]